MRIIKLMFASIYSVYFKSQNEETPIFRAIGIFVFIEFCFLFFIYTIFVFLFSFNSFYNKNTGPFIIIGIILLLFFLNSLYFTEKRVEVIYKDFEKLPLRHRKVLTSLVILIAICLPIFSLFFRIKFS